MAFDGIVIHAMTHELAKTLSGGRVDKIYQPLAKELILRIRTRGANHQLFLSADPTHPRLHLTDTKFINPETPTMFCMLLRKYLENSYIRSVSQWNLERVIKLEFETTNDIGDPVRYWLVIEIMGRHSNIIFVDPKRKVILDCIHHVNYQFNSYRELLPGREYTTPPAQSKANLLTIDEQEIQSLINDWTNQADDTQSVSGNRFFLANFQGISPQASEALWKKSGQNPAQILEVCLKLKQQLLHQQYTPCIIKDQNGVYRDFSAIDLADSSTNNGAIEYYETINQCTEIYYSRKTHQVFVQREIQDLLQKLQSAYKRAVNKIAKLQDTLKDADEAEQYKLMGELLTANLYMMTKGAKEIEVVNYYDPEQATLSIPLDPKLTPNQNAQNYYKKYNKQKNSIPIMNEQILLAKQEQQYLESILQQLETAELRDIAEIRQELIEEGYIIDKQANKQKRQKNKLISEPMKYRSSTGIEIWVGRNNKQNDQLTTQSAGKNETWLHTKDIPGSHVVIRSQQYDQQTLQEAATLAAYYSKARESSQVPVDYTLIRNVKKPSGSKPGYVIYEQQRTLYVTPDEGTVNALAKL